MVVAFDVNEVRDYSLKADIEPKTVFQLGHLDTRLRNYLRDQSTRFSMNTKDKSPDAKAEIAVAQNELSAAIVRYGVKGWTNFLDKAEKEIKFDTTSISVPGVGNRQGLTDRLVDFLQPYLEELAEAIMKQNTVSEQDEKNS